MNPPETDRIRITGAILTDAAGSVAGDLLMENGRILATGEPCSLPPSPGFRVIDAAGKRVIPGGFDPHVHMALSTPAGPSCDDFRSGSLAALAGGTTFFIDFVTPRRGQSLREALALRRVEATESRCGWSLHMGVSEWNPAVAAEIVPMVERENIRSFKAYLAYNDTIGISLKSLEELMRLAGPAGARVLVHCEAGDRIAERQAFLASQGMLRPCCHAAARPAEAETEAIARVLELSARTGCPVYIVHVSTGKGAALIASAKASGVPVAAETCLHYLLFDDSVYDPGLPDRAVMPFVFSPPVRSAADREELWERLADGTFDVVATDHCPFSLAQKETGIHDFRRIPNGTGSVGHRLSLLYTLGVASGRITPERFVGLVSANPASIFGFGNRKGKLSPGFDADVVIWDPSARNFIPQRPAWSRCDHDLFAGREILAAPERVFVAGREIDLTHINQP